MLQPKQVVFSRCEVVQLYITSVGLKSLAYVRHYLLTFLDLLNSTVDDTDDVGVGLRCLHMTLCMCGAVTFSPIFDCWECLESET